MVASTLLGNESEQATWTARSASGDAVTVPDTTLMFQGDYGRIGHDLLISDGTNSFRIADYFKHTDTPDLVSPEGAVLDGRTVELLAGPTMPGQYAQAGNAPAAAPIGQVETVTNGARVQRADGTVETLAVGTKVFQNDVVTTLEGGGLSLTFLDGTIFTLSANARMVLNEMVFDPASQDNSAVFNLVEGSFVFIAGQVAGSGGMEVNTPVATMGIRGTTVKVDIETTNGVTTVQVSLNIDPDGGIGQVELTDLNGNLIANITTTDTKWIVSPVDGETREIARTPVELANDQIILNQAISAFQSAVNRVQQGDQFVSPDDPNEPDQQPPQDDTPPNDQDDGQQGEEPEQRGDLGSGIETASATDTRTNIGDGGDSSTGALGDSSSFGGASGPRGPLGIDDLGSGPRPSGSIFTATDEAPTENGTQTNPVPLDVANSAPVITLPTLTGSVQEDGAIALSGFNLFDADGDILTVTLTAGSTVSIAPGSGVTLLSGTGTDDEQLVIEGTPDDLNTALNSIIYKPTPNADDEGSLQITVTDGTNTSSATLVVDIEPIQDAPTALDDSVSRDASSNTFAGDLLLNDSDPDTTPVPDVLTVVDAQYQSAISGSISVPVGSPFTLDSGATITLFETGQYSFDPGTSYAFLNSGETATETITYTIDDGASNRASAALRLTITGTNDAPTIVGTNEVSGEEGTTITLTANELSAVDPDDANGDLVYTITSAPTNGQIETVFAAGTAITEFTQADVDAGYVVYVHNGSETQTDSFAYQVADGGEDGAAPVSGTASINITPVNDAPTGSGLPDRAEVDGDAISTAINLSSLTLSDDDAATNALELRFAADDGTLSAANAIGVSVSGAGTSTLTLTGSIDDLISYLSNPNAVSYTASGSIFGSDAALISVEIDDLGNSGSGGGQTTGLGTIALDISQSNSPPDVTTSNPDAISEGTPPTVTAQEFDILDFLDATDPDPSDTPTVVTDSISVTAGAGSAITDTSFVSVSGTTISFDSAQYNAMAVGEQSVLVVTFDVESGPDTVQASFEITVTGTNDGPTVSGDLALSATEGETVIITSADLGATDADDLDSSLIYTVSSGPTNGQLEFAATPGTAIATFTQAQLAEGLVVYRHDGSETVTDTFSVSVSDGGEDSAAPADATITVTIDATNDAPTGSGLTTEATVTEDEYTAIDLSGLTISDADAGSGNLTVTFTASEGTLATVPSSGITVNYIDTTTLSLSGTVSDLNNQFAQFNALSYLGESDVAGDNAATIAVSINDNGNFGAGGGTDVSLGSITVSIDAVNDNPTGANLPNRISAVEDTASDVDLSTFTLGDVDAGAGSLALKLSADVGSLSGVATATVSVNHVSAGEIELSGSLADLNAYLQTASNIQYTGTTNAEGVDADIITLTASDLGNTGSGGGGVVNLGTVVVDITPVNDAPSVSGLPSNLTFLEDVIDAIVGFGTSVDLTDPDVADTTLQVRLSAESGTLDAIANSDITPTFDSGDVVLTGTHSQLESYLSGTFVSYSAPADATGTTADSISFSVSDGTETVTETISIDLTAVNDAPIITTNEDGANLVSNPGFEIGPDVTPLTLVPAGSGAISNWNVISGSVDHIQGYWTSSEGNNSIDLNGDGPGIIGTSITTVPGQTYIVTFDLAGDPLNGEPIKDVRVQVSGTTVEPSFDTAGNTLANPGWEQQTFTFVADGTSASLIFTSLDPGAAGPGIDNVSVRTAAYEVAEDTATALTNISLDDVDADTADATATFAVTNGTLIFDTSVAGGISAAQITGNGTDSLSITAPLDAINATLAATDGLLFTGDADYFGPAQLTIGVNDLGNSGLGGPQVSSKTVSILVTPVNDAPSNLDEDGFSGTITELSDGDSGENASTLGATIADLAFDDPDGATPTFQITPDAGNPSVPFTVNFVEQFVDNGGSRDRLQLIAQIEDADIAYLSDGDTIELRYDLVIDDNAGGTTPVALQATLTINGSADAPFVSTVTNPDNFAEGTQGVVDLRTIDLNTLLTFSDEDAADTPFIDPDSIVLTGVSASDIGQTLPFWRVDGTEVAIDLGLYDVLEDGQTAAVTVDFNVVSGEDVVARQAILTVDGVTDSTINVIEGTINGEELIPATTNTDDFIIGGGNADLAEEFLSGRGGNDILLGSNDPESFDGGDGNDTIITGDGGFIGDSVKGSTGNDRIQYSGNLGGYQAISYAALAAGIVFTLDTPANTATVDKGSDGTDTILDINKPMADEFAAEGFGIEGTVLADTFNITNHDAFLQLRGGEGDDIFNILSGYVRLDYAFQQNSTTGLNINLATGNVSNDSTGGTDTITGTQAVREVRATDEDDVIVGSAADESFILRAGNDTLDAGDGFDRVRYDRNGVSSVNVDLDTNSATGLWKVFDPTGEINVINTFNHTLTNVEWIRGSNLGVDFIAGSNADEKFEGYDGTDFIEGRGGNDEIDGGAGADVLKFSPGSGFDTLTNFQIGTDRIDVVAFDFTSISQFQSFNFDGTDTLISFTATDGIRIAGQELTPAQAEDLFVLGGLTGTSEDETLEGSTGNDIIDARGGNDRVFAGEGNDIVFSGVGNQTWINNRFDGDFIDGEGGDDLLIASTDSFVRIVGGEGNDTITVVNVADNSDETKWFEGHVASYHSSPTGITANLTGGSLGGLASGTVADGFGTVDTVSGITTIADSRFSDVITIDSTLENRHPENRIEVRLSAGDDSVDFLTSPRGRISYQDAEDAVSVDLGAGTGADLNLANGDQIGSDTFNNVREVKGSRFDDTIIGSANDDTLQGREGNDTLDGLGGIDFAGYWSSLEAIRVDFNLSTDNVFQDGWGSADTLFNIEGIAGSLFADRISGSFDNQIMDGYAGNDVLIGEGGNDLLRGDYNMGAAGFAGGGDFLNGGDGNDQLFGGVGADIFFIAQNSSLDTIEDFNAGQGDLIDISEFGFNSTADFQSFTFDGASTVIELGSTDTVTVTVEGVDLTSFSTPDNLFLFDVINVNTGSAGTSGDDWLRVGSQSSSVADSLVSAFQGDDIIDFSLAGDAFHGVSYNGFGADPITVFIDGDANEGSVDKGSLGVDKFFNVQTVLQSGFTGNTNGGFQIFDTPGADQFSLDGGDYSWMAIRSQGGNDTFNIDSGLVRLDFRTATDSVNANLAAGTIAIGTDSTMSVGGDRGAWEIFGGDFVDTFTGTANDESFMTGASNDIVDGGDGFDRIRYDRSEHGVSGITADLSAGTVQGTWSGVAFTDTISNIEWVRGSAGGDSLTGTTADERLDGRNGNDVITGGGGRDVLQGGNGDDTITVPDFNYEEVSGGLGQDTLVIEGGGQVIDFTQLDQLMDAPKTSGFEYFDLGLGDGTTEITIDEQSVINVSNESNSQLSDFLSGGAEAVLIDGDGSDIVNLEISGEITGASWQFDDAAGITDYRLYVFTDGATDFAYAAIDEDIVVTS
ncbi:choice-of-anchor C family protein [Pseudahrensia aquimaris]|uniref:Choice-of-anchor C family protein n=1 Tax=Pseudahrensia aquimaris TaxID=744461 RepID=A0ABW3FB52_9HYPH